MTPAERLCAYLNLTPETAPWAWEDCCPECRSTQLNEMGSAHFCCADCKFVGEELGAKCIAPDPTLDTPETDVYLGPMMRQMLNAGLNPRVTVLMQGWNAEASESLDRRHSASAANPFPALYHARLAADPEFRKAMEVTE